MEMHSRLQLAVAMLAEQLRSTVVIPPQSGEASEARPTKGRMPPLAAVIFDLDGVLVCSDDWHYQSWLAVIRERKLPFDRMFYDAFVRGLGRFDAARRILARADEKYTEEELARLADEKNDVFLRLVSQDRPPAARGAPSLLRSLRHHGMGTAVASSSRNARLLLRQNELLEHVGVVVDGHEAPAKPAPTVFLKAAASLGADPKACIAVEDSAVGIDAAQAAGMAIVAIGTKRQFSFPPPFVDELCALSLERLIDIHRRWAEDTSFADRRSNRVNL